MIDALVHPITALIPPPLERSVRTIIDGESGELEQALHSLNRSVVESIAGAAGDAVAQSVRHASEQVLATTQAGALLDSLEDEAEAVIRRAIADLVDIAQRCARELVRRAVLSMSAGPAGANPVALSAALMPVALAHYEEAQLRLRELEMELGELAGRVAGVDIPRHLMHSPGALDRALGGSSTGAEQATTDVASVAGMEGRGSGDADPRAHAAVAAAKSAMGTPYRWGGNTPGVGLDCSGLTKWAYAQAGVDIPRVADAQAVGPQIARENIQPGDLAVWDGHVAMVVDKSTMIEAGDPVGIHPIRESNMGMKFKGFYRPTG